MDLDDHVTAFQRLRLELDSTRATRFPRGTTSDELLWILVDIDEYHAEFDAAAKKFLIGQPIVTFAENFNDLEHRVHDSRTRMTAQDFDLLATYFQTAQRLRLALENAITASKENSRSNREEK
jgi:hypothetical protein